MNDPKVQEQLVKLGVLTELHVAAGVRRAHPARIATPTRRSSAEAKLKFE